MAGVLLEFDMGDAQTPRGRAPDELKMKARAKAEGLKRELASKVRASLLKLKDRDTQQQALLEMQKVCDDLRPEHVHVVHTALFAFDGDKSQYARAQSARLFADVAKAQFDVRSLSKVVGKLCERARDSDCKVREACAETLGELARIFCSSAEHFQPQQQRLEETQDLDASAAVDAGPSLSIFFNPILKSMEAGDTNGQIGNALALAHVVFNSAAYILPHLEALTQRILAIMDKSTFMGRADLLIAVANIIEVCPDGFSAYLEHYFARIQAATADKDFNVRKAAMEAIETLASRLEPDAIQGIKVRLPSRIPYARSCGGGASWGGPAARMEHGSVAVGVLSRCLALVLSQPSNAPRCAPGRHPRGAQQVPIRHEAAGARCSIGGHPGNVEDAGCVRCQAPQRKPGEPVGRAP